VWRLDQMSQRGTGMNSHRGPGRLFFAGLLICAGQSSTVAHCEDSSRSAQAPPWTPRSAAQIDLTGYWVSVITQDWIYRMVTPRKGDLGSVPLNATGQELAKTWDPSRDLGRDAQCMA